MSRSLSLAVIPGDGIGQEVVTEGLKVLTAVLPQDVKLETKDYDFGARRYHATGQTLTTPSCSARSATRRCRPASWSAASCSSCGSPSTTM
jgi:3-isopropylmalate dehydrogenase